MLLSQEDPAPVQVAYVLHGEQQGDPAQAHDELAPLEVGRPGAAQQVAQLFVDGIVPGE